MDYSNKEKLQDLLIFPSSKNVDEVVTLKEYVERMPEDQEVIYYVAGKDRASVERLPQMELLRDKGLEVLYLFDRIDEFVIDTLREYEGKKFKSVSRGDLDLKDEESEQDQKPEEIAKNNEDLLKAMKEQLQEKVADVKISNRLKSSAVCLVSSDAGISLTMEQVLAEMEQAPMFKANRILEVNPNHQIFTVLKQLHDAGQTDKVKEYSDLLYSQALLVEGFTLEDPVAFANKMAELMVAAGK